MTVSVSRGTVSVDGQKPCARCGRRPRRGRQSYCGPCHREYMREWREGKINVTLTRDEWAMIRRLRAGAGLMR